MLSKLYSLFLSLCGYRPLPTPPETHQETHQDDARDARNSWRIYRAHLQLAHDQAATERCLGAVCAINERLDRELRGMGLSDARIVGDETTEIA